MTLLKVTPEEVIAQVAEITGVESELLRGRCIERRIAQARHVAMYVMREVLPLTLSSVAEYFGCTPSAVYKAAKRFADDEEAVSCARKVKRRLKQEAENDAKQSGKPKRAKKTQKADA